MSAFDLSADPELLAGFLDEAKESLDGLDRRFVEMEARPGDLEPVNAIFRAVHSLKGNAAFFGFMAVKNLAHDLENVLDQVRKGHMPASRQVTDALLEGLDVLRVLVAGLKSGAIDPPDQAGFDLLLTRLRDLPTQTAGSSSVLADLVLVEANSAHLPDDAKAALARIRQALIASGGQKSHGDPLAEIGPLGRLTAVIDAVAAGRVDDGAGTEVARILADLKSHASPDDAVIVAEMIEGFNAFHPTVGFDSLLISYLRERIPKLKQETAVVSAVSALTSTNRRPRSEDTSPRSEGSRPRSEATSREAKTESGPKSMRVAEATVDAFLDQVGELLVVGDMYAHLHKRLAADPDTRPMAKSLRRANETFATVSNRLQRGIMALRQVPIRPLLNKVPRLVRDVAQFRGKDILVVLEGEDLVVDKSLIELLDAPLTHIARNAADHGIEAPVAREAAGKPAQGLVRISAATTDRMVTITIADDGKGIDLAAIRNKAESLGIAQPGIAMSEQDIVDFIFAPGVSTAKEVTEISGRGVGMDVVRRAIDESGGGIQVATVAGQGTTITIRIPKSVTTQIMPGYLVKIGNRIFAIPLERVLETFKAIPGDLQRVVGRGRCIQRRGDLMPVLSGIEVLNRQGHDWDQRSQVLVAVSANRRKLALVVDGVLGVQKVVLRPMAGLPSGAELITGSALLGDGSLALVLDVDLFQNEVAA
ncbi:chemotaxis protein CheA [Planctomycetota bacterium]|nr:chemotaxis protein CheA [Planctomycetota bacterium]